MALKRGNRWQGSVGSKEGRIRVLFSSEADAAKWEKVQAARVAAGLPVERPNGLTGSSPAPVGRKERFSTLGELVALASIGWHKKKAPLERELRAKQLIDFYGRDKPITDLLDEEEQQRLIDHYRTGGRSASTINALLTVLRTLSKKAYQKGVITAEQFAVPIEKLTETPARRPYLQTETEAKYLKAIQDLGLQDYYDLTCIYRDTGARLHEPLHSEWVDWFGHEVRLMETKNGDPRTVPLTARIKGIITRRPETLRNQPGPISIGPAPVRWLGRAPLMSHTRALPVSRQPQPTVPRT